MDNGRFTREACETTPGRPDRADVDSADMSGASGTAHTFFVNGSWHHGA